MMQGPLLEPVVLRPSGSGACPSTWPELLGDGAALGAIGRQASAVSLCSPLVDELDLGEDRLSWPHPTNSGEALFVVDDATE